MAVFNSVCSIVAALDGKVRFCCLGRAAVRDFEFGEFDNALLLCGPNLVLVCPVIWIEV